MPRFVMGLAGVPIAVSARFDSTRAFCADYLTDLEPVEHVTLTPADLEAESVHAEAHDLRMGLRPVRYTEASLEFGALHRKVAAALLSHGAVVFHAAAVAQGGLCYLITAPSGTGKTTHARSWIACAPGSFMLCGDKPLLTVEGGTVMVHGTPWCGKEGMGVPGSMPLAGVGVLARGDTDEVVPARASEALADLMRATHAPEGAGAAAVVASVVAAVCETASLWRITCTTNPHAGLVSARAMAGVAL